MCVCVCRRDCETMSGELCKAGLAALCYHAGLIDSERSSVQQRWLQEDRCKVGGGEVFKLREGCLDLRGRERGRSFEGGPS